MPSSERALVLVYQFLWFKEIRLLDELTELRRRVNIKKHEPDDLIKLYDAEMRYKIFKDLANELTKILENS